jgi:hypothetical protein
MHSHTFIENGHEVLVTAEFEKGYKATRFEQGEPDFWVIHEIYIDGVAVENLDFVAHILGMQSYRQFELEVNDLFNDVHRDWVNYILYNIKPY